MALHLHAQAAVCPAGEGEFPGGEPSVFETIESARGEGRCRLGRNDGAGATESWARQIDPAAAVAEIG